MKAKCFAGHIEINEQKNNNGSRLHQISRKSILYLIPPLIVAAVLLLVYALKGIYPFGGLTVTYGDMDQHYIPFSYHIYDVFHHGKSLFWDPYLGTGSNIFGIEALSGMFSPISWLVIFSARENIPQFASFLLLIRMALLSFTSFIFMNRMFRSTPAFWRVALSVMYAFSGYVLIFYTNMPWIDCAILFPLILLALKDLLDRGRIIGYVCALSVNLIVSYYISFMVLLFLFFSSGVFLMLYIEKSRRKKVLIHLGIGTISALLLTSFVTVPAFLQSTSSMRFGGASYPALIATDASLSVTLNKAVFFFFAATALVVFAKILWNFKRNKKMASVFVLLMAFTVSQVFVEAINILWYGGSYVCYPLRFGFIPLFLLLAGCGWYFSDGFVKKRGRHKKQVIGTNTDDLQINTDDLQINTDDLQINTDDLQINIANSENLYTNELDADSVKISAPESVKISVPEIGRVRSERVKKQFQIRTIHVLYALIALAAYLFAIYQGSTFGEAINKTLYGYWGISEESSGLFMLAAILFGITIWILLKLKDGRIKYALLSVVIITEIFTHSMWYIGVLPRTEGHVDDWTPIASELNSDLKIDNDTISRYKDAESVMNANYPLVMGAQAVSSYLHVIEARQQTAFRLLGYSSNYTRILDTGGTLFSDMVLNVNSFLTSKPRSLDLFDLAGESGGFYLYKNKYTLPVGLVFPTPVSGSESADSLDFKENTNPLDNQNAMYRTLFDTKEDLIEIVQSSPILSDMEVVENGRQLRCILNDSGQPGIMRYEFKATGMNLVYLSAASISHAIYIKVNNQIVSVPTFGNISNTSFPISYNNGILELGLYRDETVKVEIYINENVTFESFAIGSLSVEKMKALSARALSSTDSSNKANQDSNIAGNNNNVMIKGNTIRAAVTTKQTNQSLFLPVNYDRGWKCTINGKSAAVGKIFGTFLLLDLAEGPNEIELRFVPRGFEAGFLLSGLTLLLWMVVFFVKKREKIAGLFSKNAQETDTAVQKPEVFQRNTDDGGNAIRSRRSIFTQGAANAVYITFWAVYFAAVFFIYVIPILSFIARNVSLIFSRFR